MDRITKAAIATGSLKPHQWLTNISVAYFQNPEDFVAPSIFPIVPVGISEGTYRTFSLADLARDNVALKPEYGSVDPFVISEGTGTYSCEVAQIRYGLDKIKQVNYSRMNNLPGATDPKIGASKACAEQMLLHLDNEWAKRFFTEGVWEYEFTGDTSFDFDQKKVIKLTDSNCEPIKMFHALSRLMKPQSRRKFNKLVIGTEVFEVLINMPDILDRIKMGGTTTNPAIANEKVLAELLGFDEVKVVGSTINRAGRNKEQDMQYICDPKAALLAYVPNTPSIDTPSAGYIFTWDPMGNGNPMNVQTYEGAPETHTEWVEGLMSYSMNQISQPCGLFIKKLVD